MEKSLCEKNGKSTTNGCFPWRWIRKKQTWGEKKQKHWIILFAIYDLPH